MTQVVALAGGVGGAKLADGVQAAVGDGRAVIVNTGDDFVLHGLAISPDLDTVLYTLAGLANPDTGWGVAGDTWTALGMLERDGEETWFRIGDADLATNLRRTRLLREGATLTDVTASLASALGLPSHILPATDDRLRTIL